MTSSMLRRDFIKQAVRVGASVGVAVMLGRDSGSSPDAAAQAPESTQGDDDTTPDRAPAAGADERDGTGRHESTAEEATPAVLGPGDSGEKVRELQDGLGRLGYWCGSPDGHYGGITASAVTAAQKVAGLTRDGLCGPATRRALSAGIRPTADTRAGHVIEIHRDTQVLLVVDSGRVGTILATCTGSEIPYESRGRTWDARTPPGSYHVYYSKEGWDHGPLGDLWRPMFFNGGIAVHGSTSVPPYPASHGCCRLTIPAMNMLLDRGLITMGTAVTVY